MSTKVVVKLGAPIEFANKKYETLRFKEFKVSYTKLIPDSIYDYDPKSLSKKQKIKLAGDLVPLVSVLSGISEETISEMAIEDMLGIVDKFGKYFDAIFDIVA